MPKVDMFSICKYIFWIKGLSAAKSGLIEFPKEVINREWIKIMIQIRSECFIIHLIYSNYKTVDKVVSVKSESLRDEDWNLKMKNLS